MASNRIDSGRKCYDGLRGWGKGEGGTTGFGGARTIRSRDSDWVEDAASSFERRREALGRWVDRAQEQL